jgi:hypothetical protein
MPNHPPKALHHFRVRVPLSHFRRDYRNNADDLRLRRQPAGIEAIGRPRQIFGHAVEAEAEEMLDPLGRRPPVALV